ncbi:hypothetical protein SOVF_009590 [Spinacia oleracea]|nr:hypothetical protein SOVF_009590 [Spinacia oleracea]
MNRILRLQHVFLFNHKDSGPTIEETSCYGGKASLDSIVESWNRPQTNNFQKDGYDGSLEDFQQWVTEISFAERVSWAVGWLFLTAGLFFMRKGERDYVVNLEGGNLYEWMMLDLGSGARRSKRDSDL